MQSELEVIYYRRRAGEHRGAAECASNDLARACHQRFADAYDHRVRELEVLARRSTIHAVR